jgi:hypothetical protein
VLLSHHVLAVSPLLELSPAVSPSAADLASYTLKLEATYSKVGAAGVAHEPLHEAANASTILKQQGLCKGVCCAVLCFKHVYVGDANSLSASQPFCQLAATTQIGSRKQAVKVQGR